MILRTCLSISVAASLWAASALAAEPPQANKVFDRQLNGVEREFVSLVEAMPARKFNFAPSNGAFEGVRTFAQQAMHAASVIDQVASLMLGQKNPVDMGKNENGPAGITDKAAVVQFVKDAFALAHKAMATLRNDNLMEEIGDPSAKNKRVRVDAANMIFWHTFDHYGQMVEYARMNNVVPPASR